MKDLLSDHRLTLIASIGALLTVWAVLVNPGGSSPGLFSIPVLATLLTTTTVVWLRRTWALAASPAPLIQKAQTLPMARPAVAGKGKVTP